MNDGTFFCMGMSNKYVFGQCADNELDKFAEKPADFFKNESDKVVDIEGGKHFVAALTESGKIITQGYIFYRYIPGVRRNAL